MSVKRFRSGELQLAYRLVNSRVPRLRGLRGQTRGSVPSAIPLVFLHGLEAFSHDWVPVASALGREAACLDQRGCGDSDWSGDYSLGAMAADVGALLDHLGWTKAILVGHGIGARNALYFAARHPRRAAGLALVDYAPEYAPEGLRRAAESIAAVPDLFPSVDAAMAHFKAAREKRLRFQAYLRKVEGGYALKRDTWFRDQCRGLLERGAPARPRADPWKALARLRVPALLIRGARSALVAPAAVEKMRAAHPALRVAEVDAGHDVAADNITALVAALKAFVAPLK